MSTRAEFGNPSIAQVPSGGAPRSQRKQASIGLSWVNLFVRSPGQGRLERARCHLAFSAPGRTPASPKRLLPKGLGRSPRLGGLPRLLVRPWHRRGRRSPRARRRPSRLRSPRRPGRRRPPPVQGGAPPRGTCRPRDRAQRRQVPTTAMTPALSQDRPHQGPQLLRDAGLSGATPTMRWTALWRCGSCRTTRGPSSRAL